MLICIHHICKESLYILGKFVIEYDIFTFYIHAYITHIDLI